jgi:putative ABC transport system permease protein
VIRHVFKLVWNRKRATGLILVELLICFLVLCGILAAGVNVAYQWSRPIGFDYENVWGVVISGMDYGMEAGGPTDDRKLLADLIRTVQSMPEVESAAVSTNAPFSGSSWINGVTHKGREIQYLWTVVSDDIAEVLRLELRDGRWPDETDAALGYRPVVLTASFARDIFGDENPIGKEMPQDDEVNDEEPEPDDESEIERVVGVMEDYHRRGMLEDVPYTALIAVDFEAGDEMPNEMLVRVRPGTTADFEERLVRTAQTISPRWSFDTTLLDARRGSAMTIYLMPMLIAAVVAMFLVVMVGLGLVGVLWLSVARRTSELGLRRAMGASGVSVRRQVVGELWALTAVAVSVGALIFLQLPLFGANFGVGWPVFLGGVALATLVIYSFVTLCGLYPAWLATRIQPATALQYE